MKTGADIIKTLFNKNGAFELGERIIKAVGLAMAHSTVVIGIRKEYDNMSFKEIMELNKEEGTLFENLKHIVLDKVDLSNTEAVIVITNMLMRLHFVNAMSNAKMKDEWESQKAVINSVQSSMLKQEQEAIDLYVQIFEAAYHIGFTKEECIKIIVEPLEEVIVEVIYGKMDRAAKIMERNQDDYAKLMKQKKGEA